VIISVTYDRVKVSKPLLVSFSYYSSY